jgi:prephenate dehydrogenase
LALAIKRYQNKSKTAHTFTIVGSDTKPNPMKAAEKIGAVDSTNRSLAKAVGNANLVILNIPPGQYEDLYARLGAQLRPSTVVLDLALLKLPAIESARRFFPKNDQGVPVAFLVGITPVVNIGGLYSGEVEVEAARADLFDDAEILVTPDPKCPAEAITLAEDVIRLVGGRPRFMDPAEHDGLIAATEGLPAALGVGLFYMLLKSEGWSELRRMVNPSLALTIQNLRCQSDKDLFAFFTHNRENLVRHLEMLIGTLDEMHDILADQAHDAKLEALLARVQTEWEKWDLKRTTGNWDGIQIPERPGGGLLSGLFGFGGGRSRLGEADDE